jgi:zinc protease
MQTFRQFLQNGPSEEELKNAKQNITGGFPLRISTNAKTLEYLASIGFYRLPLDYLDTYCAKVDAVTINQIRETFQRRIIPEHFATVIVGTGSN